MTLPSDSLSPLDVEAELDALNAAIAGYASGDFLGMGEHAQRRARELRRLVSFFTDEYPGMARKASALDAIESADDAAFHVYRCVDGWEVVRYHNGYNERITRRSNGDRLADAVELATGAARTPTDSDPACTADCGYPALCHMYPDEIHEGCPRQAALRTPTEPEASTNDPH